MPDIPEENVETTDISLEDLQKELQSLKGSLTEKDKKIAELSSVLDEDKKKAFERREQAKREAEQALLEQEKFKDAYNALKRDFDEYKGQWNEEKYTTVKGELDSYIQRQKDKLLEQLDEDDRKTFADLPLEKLEAVVAKLSDGSTVNVDSSTVHRNTNGKSKKWKDMTEKERLELTNADPARATELIKEFNKEGGGNPFVW